MSRDLDPLLVEAEGRLQEPDPWIWLYEVEVPTDPPTRFRVTSYTETVSFDTDSAGDPLQYAPASVTHTSLRQNRDGDLHAVRVAVGNVNKQIGNLIDLHNGLTGQPARILLVRSDSLDNPGARIEWRFKVARSRMKDDVATFELRQTNLTQRRFPAWRYLGHGCRFAFGGPRCGYQIPTSPGETVGTGFSTCGKTFEQCDERGDDEVARGLTRKHPERAGFWRGIPRS